MRILAAILFLSGFLLASQVVRNLAVNARILGAFRTADWIGLAAFSLLSLLLIAWGILLWRAARRRNS